MRVFVAAIAATWIAAGVADAAPRKVMVLRADGKIDATARTKIDAGVLKLAGKIDGDVSQADITFTDATATVGCTGDITACGDQVLDTLAVDELVVVTVEPAPGGDILVSVVRVSKVSQKEAHGKVPAAKPEAALTDAIGSLFGVAPKTAPKPAPTAPAVTTTPAPVPVEPTPIAPAATPTPSTTPGTNPVPPPVVAQSEPEPEPTVTAAPTGVVSGPEGGHGRTRRLAIGGIAGGGALMVIGVVLWNAASEKQSEIDKAPTRSHDDLVHLQALESSADSYALWGNITFLTGAAVAGAGGFLLWRGRHSHQTARLTPMPVDHGAGVALTFGASP